MLRWARILVRVNGRSLPKTVEVKDGSCKFSLQLWWEIPPYVKKLQEARVSLRSSSPEVKDEVCGASRAIKRVVGGGGQSRQIADKDCKSVTGSGVRGPRKPTDTPIDGSGDPNLDIGSGGGSSRPIPLEAHVVGTVGPKLATSSL